MAHHRYPERTMTNPRYSLTRENGDLIVTARDVSGFFAPSDTFWLTGCTDVPPRQLGNVELRVLDSSGRPLGAYFLGATTVDNSRPHPLDHTLADVLLHGALFSPPHPLAESIWNDWHRDKPTTVGTWIPLPPAGREAWLEVVRLHHRWASTVDHPQGTVISLPTAVVHTPVDFYCALGEAINGPAGYFGANLDSLADCLRGGFGVTPPFVLRWQPARGFTEIIDVLTGAGIQIVA
jgi:hypothetical protein